MNQEKIQSPISVAALTGGVNTPSSRFRIRQHIECLGKKGVTVQEYIPYFEKSGGWPSPLRAAARIPGIRRARKADLVWLNKELVQGYPTFERWLKRPRVLDADDAIWLSRPLGFLAGRCIAAAMDAVIAGNTYLANYFEKYCSEVHIVPTGIDLKRSYAYGNHQADLPLLESVGYPHAVEPSKPLLKVATAKNWPILAYR